MLMVALPITTALKTSPSSVSIQAPANESLADRPAVTAASDQSVPSRSTPISSDSRPIAIQTESPAAPIIHGLEPSLPVLVIAWLIGLVLVSARMIYGVAQSRRIVRGAAKSSHELETILARLANRVGVGRAVRVLESVHVNVPMVIGWVRPVIIVPASILTGLAPWQLEMLLAHELSHVRRYDFLVNMLQTVIETLLFFHPAAWWLSERIREERENCCDDIAVSICGGDRQAYTSTLLALEESRDTSPVFAAAADGNSDRGTLLRRAMRLMTGAPAHLDLGGRWIAGVITILAALFTTGPAVGRAAAIPLRSKLDVVAMLAPESKRPFIVSATSSPDTVVRYRGTASFADRWDWAADRGRQLGSSRYWIGYLVAGDPTGFNAIYMDRDTPVRSGPSTFMGRMRFSEGSNLIFTGSPLAPLIGDHSPRSVAIFLQFDRSDRDQVTRVHVGSYKLPVSFDHAPVIWIDSATDNESISKLRTLFARQTSLAAKRDLVSAIGSHQDANIMLPTLSAFLQSSDEPESVRRDVVDVISDISDPRTIPLLARIARSDRSAKVSQDAIESFENIRYPSATDTLIAFANSTAEPRLRRAAIETLGNRRDPRVVAFLKNMANGNGDERSRRAAIEALGNMHEEGFVALTELVRNGNDPHIRGIAVEQLPETGRSERTRDILLQIIRNDPDESVKRKAIEALGEVRDKMGLDALKSLALSNQSERLRREAMEMYAENADAREVVAFLKSTIDKDPSQSVKINALELLAEVDYDAGKAAVRELARSSPDPRVRSRALEILTEH
jgi:beta-lactamase regulating signal transducer with metallopeptidase domain/HEAT repeat protein